MLTVGCLSYNWHPALIVRCAGVADVLNAGQFARTHNLVVAVRGGSHNVAGNATCEGGMLIDPSLMKSARRTACASPPSRETRAQYPHLARSHQPRRPR